MNRASHAAVSVVINSNGGVWQVDQLRDLATLTTTLHAKCVTCSTVCYVKIDDTAQPPVNPTHVPLRCHCGTATLGVFAPISATLIPDINPFQVGYDEGRQGVNV